MIHPPVRTFSLDFKLQVLDRIGRGETIAVLSIELGVAVTVRSTRSSAPRAAPAPF